MPDLCVWSLWLNFSLCCARQEVQEVAWKPDWVAQKGGGGGPNPSHRGLKVDNPFADAKL